MTGAPEPLDRLHPGVVHHIVNTLGWPGLRPLQEEAIEPLLDGADAVLLAPTAGGKTEAASFPLLSRMAAENWTGTSVLYVCPLKALLNNLLPRLETYTSWLGRTTALWHGDVSQPRRKRILRDRPDILLTTPESLEAMLVSANVDHRAFFSGLRTIVVDEVHAFAGDDRGWHLLAVLERLERVVGRSVQRVGLSATVGNPDQLLAWLQGSGRDKRAACVVAPHLREENPALPPPGDIQLDYVGSLENAATVITSLHHGEKRLVFCESRRQVEMLGESLRAKGVTTFLSHASLSMDERRRAEEAFADARDCVIVSTSTLELGIDVGDLDRVVQIDAPGTVASFLQRLGRTGRRSGSTRNCLFLATSEGGLLGAAALLLLWSRGWVEPVAAPPEPRHIVAQQVLALCLQEHRVGDRLWQEWWGGLGPFGPSAEPIVRHLIDEGFLERDSGMLFIGPEAERRFGYRHFMDLTAVFTAPPEFTVLAGRNEIGTTNPALLTEEVAGPRRLLLAGRSWKVTYIDWSRRRCFVELVEGGGKARWGGVGSGRSASYELTRSAREILLGTDPPVILTRRAEAALAQARDNGAETVHPAGTVVTRGGRDTNVRWWTWAGYRANVTLAATLSSIADPLQRPTDTYIRLREDLTLDEWNRAKAAAIGQLCLPAVDSRAIHGLKFSAALPQRLAEATLAARLADLDGASAALKETSRFVSAGD
ncbi:DEAD/DEAH box helicase [Streptomyces violascens]|uniref:ATP-dependent helicase n=1 Tax=Streptomyces violascens TaxID=67381 RepID=A0ABQ3QYK4_9ACTN|nr:DEAD/DEAH box helicase [Streptomyces violascens]GGU22382.1 ATP-dependent helicase [Streptomyces violascens]GHI42350.1 ATP-dependent helicase [Streptomyces violascens]